MTTIAYINGVIASDTLIHSDGLMAECNATKIMKNKFGWLAGCAGTIAESIRFLQIFKDEKYPCKSLNYPQQQDYTAMMISPKGDIYLTDNGVPFAIKDKYHAIGSGAVFAVAVLDRGGSAIDALKVAALRDPYTGGEIETLNLKDRIIRPTVAP